VKIFHIIFPLIFFSCSSSNGLNTVAEGRQAFNYIDESGKYSYIKDVKKNKGKIISRITIKSAKGGESILEKSVTISQAGSIKQNNRRAVAVRPLAADFLIWLNGQKYESQMRINTKSKAMNIKTKTPEGRSFNEDITFPKGQIFCFFSQLSECLATANLVRKSHSQPDIAHSFHIVWESYPYNQEYLSGIGKTLFSPANIKYDGVYKRNHKFAVEVAGQNLLFHFTKNFSFLRMFWINQGISLIPQGEDIATE